MVPARGGDIVDQHLLGADIGARSKRKPGDTIGAASVALTVCEVEKDGAAITAKIRINREPQEARLTAHADLV